MSDFDPFSGSTDSYSSRNKSSTISSGNKKYIKFGLWILVFVIAYYFIFMNSANLSFNVTNTENGSINATVIVSKDSSLTGKNIVIKSGETKKLRKGTYYYKAQMPGYISSTIESVKLKSDETPEITLEKNINLMITNIVFPEKVYIGQKDVVLRVDLKNTSSSQIYNLDNLVIKGDISKWDYQVTDSLNNVKDKSAVQFRPQTKQSVFFRFNVPDNEKTSSSNNATIGVKFRNSSKTTNFAIIEKPDVKVSFTLSDSLESGNSKNYNLVIDNSRNKQIIPDIRLKLDINSDSNPYVSTWFTNIKKGDILVDAKGRHTEVINVDVPVTAVADDIKGKLTVTSSAFNTPRVFDISLKITEPEIKLTTQLDKSTINLNYDTNTNITDKQYVNLSFKNNMDIDVKIDSVYFVDISDNGDCNNFIYISPNIIPSIIGKHTQDTTILIPIQAKDTSNIGDLTNNSRGCTLKTRFENPFLGDAGTPIEKINNLIINVK